MQRLTITVDDDIAALARTDIEAGRATSMSAWVADAMRRKALARAELVAEIEDMRAAKPTSVETVEWLATILGRPPGWIGARVQAGDAAGTADAR